MGDSIGDRMKKYYEDRFRVYLVRRTPVIIRLDGRAFHSMPLGKPFDQSFMTAMQCAAESTSFEIQGFKFGYVQSDEASFLLTDFDNLDTEAWFDYNLAKIVSISASLMSVHFNEIFRRASKEVFDGRAFNIPREEVANYFIWRYQDWQRNSLQMYCQSFFSHKEMMNKGREDQHEMLHSIGKNWAMDLSSVEKNGIFIFPGEVTSNYVPAYESLNEQIGLFKRGDT